MREGRGRRRGDGYEGERSMVEVLSRHQPAEGEEVEARYGQWRKMYHNVPLLIMDGVIHSRNIGHINANAIEISL
jgi:hypothetical protein